MKKLFLFVLFSSSAFAQQSLLVPDSPILRGVAESTPRLSTPADMQKQMEILSELDAKEKILKEEEEKLNTGPKKIDIPIKPPIVFNNGDVFPMEQPSGMFQIGGFNTKSAPDLVQNEEKEGEDYIQNGNKRISLKGPHFDTTATFGVQNQNGIINYLPKEDKAKEFEDALKKKDPLYYKKEKEQENLKQDDSKSAEQSQSNQPHNYLGGKGKCSSGDINQMISQECLDAINNSIAPETSEPIPMFNSPHYSGSENKFTPSLNKSVCHVLIKDTNTLSTFYSNDIKNCIETATKLSYGTPGRTNIVVEDVNYGVIGVSCNRDKSGEHIMCKHVQ